MGLAVCENGGKIDGRGDGARVCWARSMFGLDLAPCHLHLDHLLFPTSGFTLQGLLLVILSYTETHPSFLLKK